jgi:hypothetical protein
MAGRVTFGGLPVPGATITATRAGAPSPGGVSEAGSPGASLEGATVVTTSGIDGIYTLTGLGDGPWTLRVAMVGFVTSAREIAMPHDGSLLAWELTVRPFEEIARDLPAPPTTLAISSTVSGNGTTSPASGGQRGSGANSAVESGGLAVASGRGARSGTATATTGTTSANGANGTGRAAAGGRGFQRADVAATAPPAAIGSPGGADAPDDAATSTALRGATAAGTVAGVITGGSSGAGGGVSTGTNTGANTPVVFGAADGFLINGSVNNGAASPFAQARAFGNNRPGQRSLWNGGFAVLSNTSGLDARPYSFTGRETPRPDYTDLQFNGTFGGPIKIPGVRNRPNLFIGVQRARSHTTNMQSGLVPSLRERDGDFSGMDTFGRPRPLRDPLTGLPFPGNMIPAERISPQAAALLGYYPAPNVASAQGRYNYQSAVVTDTRQDSLQARGTQILTNREQLTGTLAYGRTAVDAPHLFGFVDETRTANLDATLSLSHRLTSFTFLRARYQLTRLSTDVTPAFARRVNVSGQAGIGGNNQDPENWGSPALTFASGVEGLSSAQYAENTSLTHGPAGEMFWSRGRHSWTFGGGIREQRFDVFSQQNARGAFAFTGAASGSDVADFLLGLPQTSTIAFGNADKRLRAIGADAYANDDWRVSASLTVNLGVRWEYESPISEAQQRLVNLDIAPGFTAATHVLASQPVGTLTGRRYGESLVRPDRGGVQPRIGVAWRPVAGSSLVVRGGYGLYRNTSVYQSMALLLAQQPPLSIASSVATSTERLLTLADGFVSGASGAGPTVLNTFAVDPDFRVSTAENWQLSVQRDLPASLTVIGTYLGTRGHHLMQQVLPNTYPAGAANPCPACPSGFVFLTSNGQSLRNAAQLQMRRRLRDGWTASVQYTLAKATDDAAAFSGAALAGASIAQDWRDVEAEYGRSAFDQRHQLVAQAQYTTGAGLTGGTLVDGLKGKLFKDWTVVTQITAGSGLPLTPISLVAVPGTGVNGTVRASLTGMPPDAVPPGYYLSPAAYAAPVAGEWGSAARNSISGPRQFGVNAALGRTFRWGDRLNLDWRFDATNLFNQVTFASVNMIVDSPQFGLPNRANQMRRLQSSLRVRF